MSLPVSVHECFYEAAVMDIETNLAFAHCLFTDGGEACFKEIPAGLKCLSKDSKKRAHFYDRQP